jgi:Ras-related protein Rab-11A
MIRISTGDRSQKIENHFSTIGVGFKTLDLKMADGTPVHWQIRDLAGQDRAENLQPFVYRADAYICVYDLTRRETYESLDIWLKRRHEACKIVVMVGNKSDKAAKARAVTRDEVCAKCEKEGYSFFETSAHTQEHVEAMMIDISQSLISQCSKKVECDKPIVQLNTTLSIAQDQKRCAC